MAIPAPRPDEDSAPFWAACAEGRLAAQRCPACTRFRWPPAEFCPHCHAHSGAWTTLSGRGTVVSFVVVERAFDPAFADKVPYVVAHIALEDTPDIVMLGNVEADTASIAVGQRVAVDFVETDGVIRPLFRPATE